jgi:hypothetical protein
MQPTLKRKRRIKMDRINRKAMVLTLWAAALMFTVGMLPSKSFAHNTAAGCGTNNTVSLSDENNWATLCSKTVDLTDGTHDCVVTGSAELSNTVTDTHNRYRFTVATVKNPSTGLAFERRVDVTQDANSADPIELEVSTTRHATLSAGTYTFYWLGRPFDSNADKIEVTAYSMGVVCTDNK